MTIRGLLLAVCALTLPACGSVARASSRADEGGTADSGGSSTDGPSFNGGTGPWRDRTPTSLPPSWPPAAATVSLAFDGTRGRVLMFGLGTTLEGWGESNDLFEWDGDLGQWNRLTPAPLPASWPPARAGQGMAWDSQRKKLTVFGGYDSEQIDTVNPRSDLWELDSTTLTWTDRTPAVLPAAWPPARFWPTFVYDAARGKMVLFGGWTGASNLDLFDDLWEWDGAAGTWTNRTPSPRPPAWPAGRYSHVAIYDSMRQRTVVFGGYVSGPLANDLWEWDGTNFVNRTPSPLPASWPAPRCEHALAYDSVRGRMVLFGGYHPILGDTWEWNGATNGWTEESAPSPSARRGATMAFDANVNRQVGVLYGGEHVDLAPPLQETWEYGAPGTPSRDGGSQ